MDIWMWHTFEAWAACECECECESEYDPLNDYEWEYECDSEYEPQIHVHLSSMYTDTTLGFPRPHMWIWRGLSVLFCLFLFKKLDFLKTYFFEKK